MAVNCEQMLKYAEDKLSDVECEAGVRMVIGRAYYACYHKAKAYHNSLDARGFRPEDKGEKTKGVHRTLIYQLQNPRVADRRQSGASKHVARLLQTVCKLRQDADYELDQLMEKIDAMQTVAEAKRLLKFLDEIGHR